MGGLLEILRLFVLYMPQLWHMWLQEVGKTVMPPLDYCPRHTLSNSLGFWLLDAVVMRSRKVTGFGLQGRDLIPVRPVAQSSCTILSVSIKPFSRYEM